MARKRYNTESEEIVSLLTMARIRTREPTVPRRLRRS